VSVRDEHNRYPLHVATSLGYAWECGVETLLQCDCDALECRDEVTGLFPFALAAAASCDDLHGYDSPSSDDDDAADDAVIDNDQDSQSIDDPDANIKREMKTSGEMTYSTLNTIFQLLRHKPYLVVD